MGTRCWIILPAAGSAEYFQGLDLALRALQSGYWMLDTGYRVMCGGGVSGQTGNEYLVSRI